MTKVTCHLKFKFKKIFFFFFFSYFFYYYYFNYFYLTAYLTLPNVRWYPSCLGQGLGIFGHRPPALVAFQPCRYQESRTGGSHRSRKFFCDPPKKIEYIHAKKDLSKHRGVNPWKEPTNPCRTESTLKRSTKNPCTVWEEKRKKGKRKKVNSKKKNNRETSVEKEKFLIIINS